MNNPIKERAEMKEVKYKAPFTDSSKAVMNERTTMDTKDLFRDGSFDFITAMTQSGH
jgi:hypothetical protein